MTNEQIELIDNIVCRYRNGDKTEDIATDYRFNEQGMRNFLSGLKKLGIISEESSALRLSKRKKPKAEKPITEFQRQICEEYMRPNATSQSVGEKFGVSSSMVCHTAKKFGYVKNKREYPYPQNLICFILGEAVDFKVTDDNKKGLEEALNQLTERERTVMKERFENNKSMKEVGKMFRVTTERIRQIEAKALRKLRHPTRMRMIISGYKAYCKEQRMKEQAIERFRNASLSKKYGDDYAKSVVLDIHNLDFSVRTLNCLVRAGIKRIDEITCINQLWSIRNMCRKSVDEVVEKAKDLGIIIPDVLEESEGEQCST